jgi:uncharacterized membrane protein
MIPLICSTVDEASTSIGNLSPLSVFTITFMVSIVSGAIVFALLLLLVAAAAIIAVWLLSLGFKICRCDQLQLLLFGVGDVSVPFQSPTIQYKNLLAY